MVWPTSTAWRALVALSTTWLTAKLRDRSSPEQPHATNVYSPSGSPSRYISPRAMSAGETSTTETKTSVRASKT